jgi:hypothetical protein
MSPLFTKVGPVITDLLLAYFFNKLYLEQQKMPSLPESELENSSLLPS